MKTIEGAFLEPGNKVSINFISRSSGKKSEQSLAINMDTILSIVRRTNCQRDSLAKGTLLINQIYWKRYKEQTGLVIELKRGAVSGRVQGISTSTDIRNSIDVVRDYKKFRYRKNDAHTDRWTYLNGRHPLFLFPYKIKKEGCLPNTDFVVLSVEPLNRRKYARYLLLPLAAAGDIITSPLQLIFLIFFAKDIP